MLDAARITLADHRATIFRSFRVYMVCTSNIGLTAASPTNPVAVDCAQANRDLLSFTDFFARN
jgi:hypothetical protein